MYTDKITMHFGLECRVPILDNNLIEFIESLNSRHKFNSKKGKIIHKFFAREYLPSEIIERKKISFNPPTNTWFKEHKENLVYSLSANKEFCSLFNMNNVRKMISDHANGKNMEKQIFLLLTFGYLLNTYKIGEEI